MEYPINGTYPSDPAGQLITGTLQAVKSYVCEGLGYLLPLAATRVATPQQLIFYVMAASVGGAVCAPSPPPAPDPLPVPPSINPSFGCEAGVLYRYWFRTQTWNYTGNSCPDLQQGYFAGVTDFVDFFGPVPGVLREVTENRIVPIYACRQDEQGRWIRYQSGTIVLKTYLRVWFTDGAGIARTLFSSSSPSSIVEWQRLYIDRRDGNQDTCGDNPLPPDKYYLPPPSGTPVDPIRPFNIPVNLPGGLINVPITIGPIYPTLNFEPSFGLYINGSPVTININPSGQPVVVSPKPLPPTYPPTPNPNPYNPSQPKPFQPTDVEVNLPECLEENICTEFDLNLVSEDCEGEPIEALSLSGRKGFQGIAELIEGTAKWLFDSLQKCPEAEPSRVEVLLTGEFSDDSTVLYCLVPVGFDWVRLTIEDYDPKVVSAYKLAGVEAEARFGWVALSLGQTDSSLRTYVVARTTTMPVPPGQPTTLHLRLSLKRTCVFKVEGIFLGR